MHAHHEKLSNSSLESLKLNTVNENGPGGVSSDGKLNNELDRSPAKNPIISEPQQAITQSKLDGHLYITKDPSIEITESPSLITENFPQDGHFKNGASSTICHNPGGSVPTMMVDAKSNLSRDLIINTKNTNFGEFCESYKIPSMIDASSIAQTSSLNSVENDHHYSSDSHMLIKTHDHGPTFISVNDEIQSSRLVTHENHHDIGSSHTDFNEHHCLKFNDPTNCGSESSLPRPNQNTSTNTYVTVGHAEKHGAGFKDAYVTYEINSHYLKKEDLSIISKVRRRYQDFEHLVEQLDSLKSVGVIIPPLPDKDRLGYMDRFSPEFIEKRQGSLERFLNRLLAHSRIASLSVIRSFLLESKFRPSDRDNSTATEINTIHSEIIAPINFILDDDITKNPSKITDILLSIDDVVELASSENPDGHPQTSSLPEDNKNIQKLDPRTYEEKLISMRMRAKVLQSHLDATAALHGKAVTASRSLAENLLATRSSCKSISTLFGRMEALFSVDDPENSPLKSKNKKSSVHEKMAPSEEVSSSLNEAENSQTITPIEKAYIETPDDQLINHYRQLRTLFGDFSLALEQRSWLIASGSKKLERQVHLPFLELANYVRSAISTIRIRDNQVTEYEACLKKLKETLSEYEAVQCTDKRREHSDGIFKEMPRKSFFSLLGEKLSILSGRNPQDVRAERLVALEDRLGFLKNKTYQAWLLSSQSHSIIFEEFSLFASLLDAELSQKLIPALAEAWCAIHLKDVEIWDTIMIK